MNGKLILLTLFIVNIIIKAQLSSFSENFDTFTTTGGNSLPQNGWNKYIVSSGGSAPLLSVKETGSGNKYIQAYSLFSANTPFYLISPQITAPSGNQTITVTTLRIGGTPGSGSLEIGLVASPSDLSGFTSLGNPIPIDTSTPTVTTLNVPASSYQYIAFKFWQLQTTRLYF
ncbi:hypothetical protein ODZ84_22515 [Chryseobacterium fluminis]|uniref:hypothetical protein n=1 Tax=Chryseobacterium fluminis TaxID=2983606 RepID=UPI0022531639|nr:hypothetical protein [Chryseobacterium sp. MMS21-Ot14]UZT97909.1 hypothetical protein ODZ84_22515 [Chryseobacterium sp. MMS21-Ot14]